MDRTCRHCQSAFEITQDDLVFYDKVSPVIGSIKCALPLPTLCPSCRYQERLTWRNERNLYKRTCSATSKTIVSIWSPEKTQPPVYEQSYWWSDAWDARDYGREVDFSRPFFEQWAELFFNVPQIAMNNQMSENCEFTNQSQRNKDSYMLFCSNDTRDSLHGMWLQKCLDCVDCTYLEESELCYEMLNGKSCYRCTFCRNLENCSEVHFSKNCIGCKNCFGCVNLRSKEYCFFNEQCSKEDYERRVAELQIDRASGIATARIKAEDFFRQFPSKCYTGANCENSSGDYLMNAKNVHDCFNCCDNENMAHCQDVWRARNCQDLTETAENDFCYSVEGSAISMNTLFSKKFCDLSNSIYCSHCNFSKNLFGCVCLNHGQYCILNKQYTKDEYEALVPKIIEHMRKTPLRASDGSSQLRQGYAGQAAGQEWGEHFPSSFSPFSYNESVAQEYFPLSEEQALAQGHKWRRTQDDVSVVSKATDANQLPDAASDIPDDVVDWAIRCEATGRRFRIIKQELNFYRQMKLPLPHLHADERYCRRMALRNPRKLWERACSKCGQAMKTTYAPDRPETVYCEECYLASVY